MEYAIGSRKFAKVLFVCTGNTCRSPMAAALFNAMAQERGVDAFAQSAGIAAYEGLPASIGAVGAMEERGLDVSLHCAHQMTREDADGADVILCMTSRHAEEVRARFPQAADKTFPLSSFSGGAEVSDPFGGDAEEYEACADLIESALDVIFDKLAAHGSKA